MQFELREKNSSKIYYTGSVWETNNCGKITIIGQIDKFVLKNKKHKHKHFQYYAVMFKDKTVVSAINTCIKSGRVKNPMTPNVYGLGFIGQGNAVASLNGRSTREYTAWNSMFKRCYSSNYPTYHDCSVDPRWFNFQAFYYDIKDIPGYRRWLQNIEKMELDKDIKIPGNRIYSNSTCLFVTHDENVAAGTRKISPRTTGLEYVAIRISDSHREVFYNHGYFAKKYNLNAAHVTNCVNGKRKTHQGWRFEIVATQ